MLLSCILRNLNNLVKVLCSKKYLEMLDAVQLLQNAPGVCVVDDRIQNRFPEPILASGHDEVLVGRFRNAPDGGTRSLMLVASGDQLRIGAALSGIQLMELLRTPPGDR